MICGQYNDALFTILDSPAMQKLATEEFIIEKVLSTLYPLNLTAESKKLNLNFSMWCFYNTVQSLSIRSQEILIWATYLPKLKSIYKKVF